MDRLGQVVRSGQQHPGADGAEAGATDVLGGVYEYFLEQYAIAEGRKGGEFYTSALRCAPARRDAGVRITGTRG